MDAVESLTSNVQGKVTLDTEGKWPSMRLTTERAANAAIS